MKIQRFLGAAALLASIATPSFAQQTITFDQAVKLALTQNTAVRQAANANAIDETSVTQNRLAFLPNLQLSTSGTNAVGQNFSQQVGGLTTTNTQSMTAGVSSSLTLFNGMQNVANLSQARLSEQASDKDLTRARQTAVFTVASNYVALIAQQEQLKVQQENLTALQTQEAQIDKMVAAGVRPISDLYQVQAQVASAQASVVDAQRAVELANVDLIQTLQLDPRGTYQFVAPAVNASTTQHYDLDSLMNRAYTARTDLSAEQNRVEAAAQGVKAAAGGKLPAVSLTAGYNTGYTSANDASFSDQLNQRKGGSVGLQLSVPIFDRGNASLSEQRAELQADNARLALDARRQQVALEVRRAYLDYNAAQQRLVAAEAAVKAAQQSLDASEQRYRVGASTMVEVTQARSALVTAQSALVNARYTLVFQQSVMSYYTGDLNPATATLG